MNPVRTQETMNACFMTEQQVNDPTVYQLNTTRRVLTG